MATNIVHLVEEFQTQAQNVQAEQAVLGAIMVNNRAYADVRELIRPEHFYEPVHGRIFAAMARMISDGRVADPVTMKAEFAQDRDLSQVDGSQYLANITRAAVSVMDAPSYATVIRDCCHRRLISHACREGDTRATNGEYTDAPGDIIAALKRALTEIERDNLDDTMSPVGSVLTRLSERITRRVRPFPTGLGALDQALDGGIRCGDLYAIEAPAGSFKTGTLGTIAMNMIRNDVPFLFVTVEMDAENILGRLVAAETGCNARNLMDPERCDDALGRVKIFTDRFGKARGYFAHRPGITADGLASLCAGAMTKLGVEVVFVDYWQRIRGCGSRQSRAEFYEGVADWAADFAATSDVAVVMASQLNRNGESFGSGGLERASAWLARIQKAELDDQFIGHVEGLWLQVAKSRYSYSGDIGSPTNPTFRIDPIGPVLKEIGDWRRA